MNRVYQSQLAAVRWSCVSMRSRSPGLRIPLVLVSAALPVILMSGYGSDRLQRDDEHVVCLQKPMAIDELEAALRRVCAPA